MNDYTFGNFLYTLRTEKDLSQSRLGQLLGVTNKAVSKGENGSAKPNTVLIPKLAEKLGVTVVRFILFAVWLGCMLTFLIYSIKKK